MLKVRVVILLPEKARSPCGPATRRRTCSTRPISPRPNGPGSTNRPAGRGSDTLPGAKRLFLPMRTGRGAVGVVGIDSDEPGPLLTPDQRRLLDALVDQAALAIERVHLVDDVDRARAGGGDRPAARGAADLDLARSADAARLDPRRPPEPARSSRDRSTPPTRRRSARDIQDEAERLNRFIANLLDMTRLESGAIAPNASAAIDVGEVVGSALRARRQDAGRAPASRSSSPPTCRCSTLDAVLFEQVLFNLLDNAGQICAGGLDRSALHGWRDGADVVVQVLDEGPGIPPERSGAHLRQVLPRAEGGPAARRTPAWASRSAAASSRRMGGTIAAATGTTARRRLHHRLPVPRSRHAMDSGATMAPSPHHPGRRGRAADPASPADQTRRRTGTGRRGGERPRRPCGASGRDARAGPPRSRPARHRRPRPDPDAARPRMPVPIVVLSSRGDEAGKVGRSTPGADELLCHQAVRLGRRAARPGSGPRCATQLGRGRRRPVFRCRDWPVRISAATPSRWTARGPPDTKRSTTLLALLVRHAGKVLTHATSCARSGARTRSDTQYLRAYIRRCGASSSRTGRTALLVTEPGVGYRLRAPA